MGEVVAVDKQKLEQTFDIREELGVDLSNEPRLRQEIGQAMIDIIVNRSEGGKSIKGNRLKKYDEDYIESEEFQDFGKSANDVNMTLTGDMLEAVDLEDGPNTIKVFLREDQVPKGVNHHLGITLPKREWFGINKKELESIKSQFSADFERIRQREQTERERARSVVDLLTVERVAAASTAEDIFGELFAASFPDVDLGDF